MNLIECLRSLAALAVLAGALWLGLTEGLASGLAFLLAAGLFLGLVTGLADMLLAPFRRRPGG